MRDVRISYELPSAPLTNTRVEYNHLVHQHEIVADQTDGKTLTDVAKNRGFTTHFHVGALLE